MTSTQRVPSGPNSSAAGNCVEVGAHSSRRANLATSITTLECEPAPISLAPSVARTVNDPPPVDFRHLSLPGPGLQPASPRDIAR